ncbi:hypothetical protein GGI12_002713 [Dipsacomyces acuminosporus]|nr:hypothetical protein GGI12_002713 [Dipsacomyces acuminosporus]
MSETSGEAAGTPLVTLYLIRHGETVVNQNNCVQGKQIDPPLNERGRKQAECVGLRFKDIPVGWVVTSTSKRAIETGAAIHSQHSNAPFDHYDALNELEFGDLEGTHVTAGYNELIAKWDVGHDVDLAAPGERGESPVSCAKRAIPCLVGIIDTAVAQGIHRVCVVVHSRLIQILMAMMVDGSLESMALYKQKKAAVNVVDVYAGCKEAAKGDLGAHAFVAREVSSTAHMPDDVVSRISSATSLANRNADSERIRFVTDGSGTVLLQRL